MTQKLNTTTKQRNNKSTIKHYDKNTKQNKKNQNKCNNKTT